MAVRRKRRILAMIFMGTASLSILLSACSSGKETGKIKEEKSIETANRPQCLQEGRVHALLETALLPFPTNQNPENIGAECAVKTAKLFKTPEEVGIDEKQVSVSPDCHYDIKTEMPTTVDVSKSNFLLCDVTIKNINMDLSDMNITLLSLVYLVPDTEELTLVGLPAYFSQSLDQEGGQKFYHFELPAGESMDASVGWWVDLAECKKENLYVGYNYGGDLEFQHYWKLDL